MPALMRRVQSEVSHGVFRRFLTSSFHTSSLPVLEETGLYGFRHLKSAKGFQRFVDDAIERSNELVTYISELPAAPQIIQAMDEISDTVCSVIDSAELCRHTHPDREFVEEASKASLRINDYLHVSILIQIIVSIMPS